MFFDGSQDDTSVLDKMGTMPDGDYKVCVAMVSQERSQRQPDVAMLKCEFEVLGGVFDGRKIFQNFIIEHPRSEAAVKIGRAKFKKICQAAVHKESIEHAEELYGCPFYVKMKTRQQKNGYKSFDIVEIQAHAFVPKESDKGPLSAEELEKAF